MPVQSESPVGRHAAGARFVLAVMSVLCLLIPRLEAQQQIADGTIVLLRGASGKYLGAAPPERLYMHPNTLGWEQWQVRSTPSGRRYLVSHHGTSFIAEPSFSTGSFPTARALHGPLADSDTGTLFPVQADGSVNGAIVAGGTVALIGTVPNSVWKFFTEDIGDGVRMVRYEAPPIPPAGRFTIVPVAEPATGRKELVSALVSGSSCLFRSAHGSRMHYVDPQNYRVGDTNVYEGPAIQGGSDRPRAMMKLQKMGANLGAVLRYGDSVAVIHDGMQIGGVYHLSEGRKFAVAWTGGTVTNDPWLIVDPTGSSLNGTRLSIGANIGLQRGGRNIGARPYSVPTDAFLYLHTNLQSWETWTLSYE